MEPCGFSRFILIPLLIDGLQYHVAEDLVTTILALLLVDLADPMAHKEPIQLAFSDKFGLDHNHYSSLWDRIGSRQPRRLSLDPYESGTTRKYTLLSN